MKIDLKNLSRKELEKLRADVDKALAKAVADEKKRALDAVQKAAKAHGFSLSDLAADAKKAPPRQRGSKKAKAGSKANSRPKYRNPSDSTQTWTGRGRQPAWFKEALTAGRTPDDMAI